MDIETHSETPQTPPGSVDGTEAPKSVKFDTEQQAKIDELIREAMGRAGRAAREEAARLKEELEVLRAQAPPTPEQITELEERATKAKSELVEAETAAQRMRKEAEILAVSEKTGFLDIHVGAELLRGRMAWVDGALRPLNAHGSAMLNLLGQPMSLQEFAQSIAERSPYLIRSQAKGGAGSTSDKRNSPSEP